MRAALLESKPETILLMNADLTVITVSDKAKHRQSNVRLIGFKGQVFLLELAI